MSSHLSRAARAGIALSVLLLVPFAVGSGTAADIQPGTLDSRARSTRTTLGEDIAYNVYLPGRLLEHGQALPGALPAARPRRLDERLDAGQGTARPVDRRRRDPADDRDHARRSLEQPGELLRRLAVQGLRPQGTNPGRPVETAFTTDLIQHVDSTYRTLASRDGRVVGGYSMGGYGAIRYSLAHPDLFVSSIVLSPAVYIPKPPNDSSTREFGAFGQGHDLFSTPIYKKPELPRGARPLPRDGPEVAHVRRGRRRRVPEPPAATSTTSTSSRCSSTRRSSASRT